ncbi:hypothetical protein LJR255_002545 [Pararhizobium sp. LjRoot255]|uniref:hypothetical protein n=1 Tax=Pararhizobium sp. LjRoot255 TaxID=3342298 RepID=UPI003ECCD91A
MKNSWFGTTAVPAIEAFLPAYRLTPENSAGADIGTILPDPASVPGHGAVTITLGRAPACLIFKHYLPIPPGRQSVAIDKHTTLQYRNILIFSI